jgi:hypothetical protein
MNYSAHKHTYKNENRRQKAYDLHQLIIRDLGEGVIIV